MPRTRSTIAGSTRSVGRRQVLMAAVMLPIAAGSGCTVPGPPFDGRGPDGRAPDSGGTAGSAPTPSPTVAGSAAAGARESLLAATAGALAVRGPTERRGFLQAVAAGHREHAAVLSGPDPVGRVLPTLTAEPTAPTTPIADPTSPPSVSGVTALAAEQRRLATAHGAAALRTSGFTALLWASLSLAARSYADAAEADEPATLEQVGRPLVPLPILPAVEAVTSLVGQGHAMVYGYQVALGRLRGTRYQQAQQRLDVLQGLRRDLADLLRERDADVPSAEAAYEIPGPVTDQASATRLLARLETALLPHCGLWLAAAAGRERRGAFDALSATSAAGRRWGAVMQHWPGWG